jgi:hypothetical protein
MALKITRSVVFGLFVLSLGCTNVFRPYAAVPPDEGLFGRAMQLLDDDRTGEARTLLETLIATYPDSAYVPRAERVLDDMWHAEGGIGPRKEEPAGGEAVTFFPPLKEMQVDKN